MPLATGLGWVLGVIAWVLCATILFIALLVVSVLYGHGLKFGTSGAFDVWKEIFLWGYCWCGIAFAILVVIVSNALRFLIRQFVDRRRALNELRARAMLDPALLDQLLPRYCKFVFAIDFVFSALDLLWAPSIILLDFYGRNAEPPLRLLGPEKAMITSRVIIGFALGSVGIVAALLFLNRVKWATVLGAVVTVLAVASIVASMLESLGDELLFIFFSVVHSFICAVWLALYVGAIRRYSRWQARLVNVEQNLDPC